MSRSAWLSVNTHAYPSWQKLLNWKDVWPNSRSSRAFRNPPLEVLDQSVFKRVVNACNKSQQQMTLKLEYIMLLNLIVLNEINLFLDYQLFSSCLFDDINGPVELLSLETPHCWLLFSVTGINNGCNQFKFKLWNYPLLACYSKEHRRISISSTMIYFCPPKMRCCA